MKKKRLSSDLPDEVRVDTPKSLSILRRIVRKQFPADPKRGKFDGSPN